MMLHPGGRVYLVASVPTMPGGGERVGVAVGVPPKISLNLWVSLLFSAVFKKERV